MKSTEVNVRALYEHSCGDTDDGGDAWGDAWRSKVDSGSKVFKLWLLDCVGTLHIHSTIPCTVR